MGIALLRIDERLIHGQTAYSWSKAYPADQFMVVDDEISKDEFQTSLLEMAVPAGKSFQCLDVASATNYLKQESYVPTMIIVKGPGVVLSLVKGGVKIPVVNVGGMYFRKDRKEFAKTVYLSQEEIATFKELADLGVKLEIRTAPEDHVINLAEKI